MTVAAYNADNQVTSASDTDSSYPNTFDNLGRVTSLGEAKRDRSNIDRAIEVSLAHRLPTVYPVACFINPLMTSRSIPTNRTRL